MPKTSVVFFKDADGRIPVEDWLRSEVARQSRVALARCRAAIQLLGEQGRELRRPHADYLRDGIFELRIRFQSVNYRILYFFAGATATVVAHGLTKEAKVPDKDIDLAIARKRLYESEPGKYYAEEEKDQ